MARYFAGNTLAAFQRSIPQNVESTTSGRFDSAFVSNSIIVTTDGPPIITPSFSASGTVWTRFDYFATASTNSSAQSNLLLATNAGANVFRIRGGLGGNGIAQAQYWNGSAWTSTGSTFSATANSLLTFTLKIELGSGFELYQGGTLVASGSGWSGGGSSITNIGYGYWYIASGQAHVSQVLIADYDLREDHYMQILANGNGHYTDGTGSYADIDEMVLDGSDAITLSASGDKKTFTKPAITLPGGLIIAAANVGLRARVSGGVVTNGQAMVRSGTADANSANLGPTSGYEPRVALFETDPATPGGTGPWTQSTFNSMEFGLEAV